MKMVAIVCGDDAGPARPAPRPRRMTLETIGALRRDAAIDHYMLLLAAGY